MKLLLLIKSIRITLIGILENIDIFRLKVKGYPKTFELFIGKDFGDFSPEFEKIDDLKLGDKIDVFF